MQMGNIFTCIHQLDFAHTNTKQLRDIMEGYLSSILLSTEFTQEPQIQWKKIKLNLTTI